MPEQVIIFKGDTRKVGLVRDTNGEWTVHETNGDVTAVSEKQLWQKRTLGKGLTHYRVVPAEVRAAVMNVDTGEEEWHEIPGASLLTGVVEPDWINLVLAAGIVEAESPEVTEPEGPTPEEEAAREARLEPQACPNGEMYIPTWVLSPNATHNGMTDVEWARLMVTSSKVRAFLMEGKPGCGKSMLAQLVAGPGHHQMSMSAASDDEAIVGAKNFNLEEGTSYDWGPIVLAMQHRHDESCVAGCGKDKVIVDELNLLVEEFATMLHSILDKNAEVFVPGFGLIRAGDGFTLIGTMNAYAGGIPDALKSRLGRPFQRQIQWEVLDRIGVDKQVIAVGKLLHEKRDQNDLEDEAPGTRELMSISAYIELASVEHGGFLPREEAMKFAFDGFGGWDVSPNDREEVQQVVEAVMGFSPDMRGIGSRG